MIDSLINACNSGLGILKFCPKETLFPVLIYLKEEKHIIANGFSPFYFH
jgi:hypothetical protein